MSFYGTVIDADGYHADRGNILWGSHTQEEKEQALVRATDYIDQMYRYRRQSGLWACMFSGARTVPETQPREFPRDNITVYDGTQLGDSVTPAGIENATYEAAGLEVEQPGMLTPVFTPAGGDKGAIIQETVGPITVKYDALTDDLPGFEQRPPNMPIVFAIERLVAPFLKAVAAYGVGIRVA